MRRAAYDLLRDGVLAPLATLAAGFVVARVTLVPFSVVAFLLTLVAAAVWFVGLGGIRDSPAEELRGPPAWQSALASPERWPEFLSPMRRALVYAAGLFVLGWAAVAFAPGL